MNILTLNLLFSTLVFWIAARIYVFPRLQELKPRTTLLPILLLHSFRHLGLMFLAPGATYSGIPAPFAYPAAFWRSSGGCPGNQRGSGGCGGRDEAPDPSCGFSTSKAHWTCLRPSFSLRSMTHLRTWVPRTGFQRSGFRRSS